MSVIHIFDQVTPFFFQCIDKVRIEHANGIFSLHLQLAQKLPPHWIRGLEAILVHDSGCASFPCRVQWQAIDDMRACAHIKLGEGTLQELLAPRSAYLVPICIVALIHGAHSVALPNETSERSFLARRTHSVE